MTDSKCNVLKSSSISAVCATCGQRIEGTVHWMPRVFGFYCEVHCPTGHPRPAKTTFAAH